MNRKWSSSARETIVTHKETGKQKKFPSVAAAGREIGISSHNAFAMLCGRSGKRSPYTLSYADGQPSRAKEAK